MEVHFTPEQEMQLAQIAANAGTDPERIVKDAALRLVPDSGVAKASALPASGVVSAMRALRATIKSDPDGWSTRDYVLHGRR